MLDKKTWNYKKKVRIGLIGCGRISKNHIKAIFATHTTAELVAICDVVKENIDLTKDFIKNLSLDKNICLEKLSTFNNFEYLIDCKNKGIIDIDLIVLTTPSGLHPHQTILAAKSGIHVCTEKPMATNWADGLSMVNACKESAVNLFVVKQNRFNKTLQLLKKQLEAGRFGKLALVTINVFWQRPQEYYDQSKWRGTKDLDGGALMNQASHYVDLIDWLIGPVETINATTATIARDIQMEDTAVLNLKWRNGALGTMAVTMLTYPKNLEGSITILGDKGSVKVGGTRVNKIETWIFEDNNHDDEIIKNLEIEEPKKNELGHAPYYENMINVLLGKEKPICNGEQGLRSLEILVAAYRSSKNKKNIYLPLEST